MDEGQTGRVPLQAGKAEQPQKRDPTRGPLRAVRSAMGWPQSGHSGAGPWGGSDWSDRLDVSDLSASFMVLGSFFDHLVELALHPGLEVGLASIWQKKVADAAEAVDLPVLRKAGGLRSLTSLSSTEQGRHGKKSAPSVKCGCNRGSYGQSICDQDCVLSYFCSNRSDYGFDRCDGSLNRCECSRDRDE